MALLSFECAVSEADSDEIQIEYFVQTAQSLDPDRSAQLVATHPPSIDR
jgi:hypothetical protein